MRRYGESFKRGIRYRIRIGIYGVISIGKNILLTEQDEDEIQLPGGGIDQGEQKSHALIREVREETGWKINPLRFVGTYQRFVFMPEYEIWAQKVCHIYYCRGIYPLSKPLEKGHVPILASPEFAIKLLRNQGDRTFVTRCLSFHSNRF